MVDKARRANKLFSFSFLLLSFARGAREGEHRKVVSGDGLSPGQRQLGFQTCNGLLPVLSHLLITFLSPR